MKGEGKAMNNAISLHEVIRRNEGAERIEDFDIAHDLLWDHAAQYVRAWKRSIEGYARKFVPFSPYEKEDFMNEAYLAAFNALARILLRGIPDQFDRYFWTELKRLYCKMATDPSQRDVLGSDGNGAPCIFKEYSDNGAQENCTLDQSVSFDPEEIFVAAENEEADVRRDGVIQKALSAMTPKQRQVWEILLGSNGNIPKLQDIGASLGISRQRVQALRDRGLQRVRKHFKVRECDLKKC